MSSITSGSSQSTTDQSQPASVHPYSLGCADIPHEMVINAVDATISRFAPAYLELMREAKEDPENIITYKKLLSDAYIVEGQAKLDLMEAQAMAPDCKVIKRELPEERTILVFSEKNGEFNEDQALEKSRSYIRLWVKLKDIKDEDPLDLLLSQLSKKILSLGYGNDGTFDIRLEKGCLSFEGKPWKWHRDGDLFKTSITVCYSNKKNWSTRVPDSQWGGDGRPADHGFFYDALKVYHRAPIPSDLEGEELNAGDYRLFIRYIEYNPNFGTTFRDESSAEKGKKTKGGVNPGGGRTPPLFPDDKFESIFTIKKLQDSLRIEDSWTRQRSSVLATLPRDNILGVEHLVGNQDLLSRIKITIPPVSLTVSNELSSLLQPVVVDEKIFQTTTSATQNTQQQEQNDSNQCAVM